MGILPSRLSDQIVVRTFSASIQSIISSPQPASPLLLRGASLGAFRILLSLAPPYLPSLAVSLTAARIPPSPLHSSAPSRFHYRRICPSWSPSTPSAPHSWS